MPDLENVTLKQTGPAITAEQQERINQYAKTTTVKEWQELIFRWALRKGWWSLNAESTGCLPRNFYELLFLMMTEIVEGGEELRNGRTVTEVWYSTDKDGIQKPEGFGIELADCAIRIMDTCAAQNIDLNEMIALKMSYNEQRPYRHGGKKA